MDGTVFRWVNRFAARTSWAHGSMVAVAKYGIGVFVVLLLVAWWQAREASDAPAAVAAAVWSALAAVVGFACVQLIGNLVDRARPYTTMPSTHLLVSRTGDFSFPSDHSTAAAAIAAGLVLAARYTGRRWTAIVAVVTAAVLGFSRVYVGAHYPGDVLGGFALGAVVGVALARPAIAILRPIAAAMARTRVGPLVAAHPDRRASTQPQMP